MHEIVHLQRKLLQEFYKNYGLVGLFSPPELVSLLFIVHIVRCVVFNKIVIRWKMQSHYIVNM